MTGEIGHAERGWRDDRQRTERRGHRPQTDRRSSRAPAGGTALRTPDLSRLVPTAVSISLSVVLSRQGCSSSFRPQRETNPGPTPASRVLERRALRLAGCRLRTGGRAALRVLPAGDGSNRSHTATKWQRKDFSPGLSDTNGHGRTLRGQGQNLTCRVSYAE